MSLILGPTLSTLTLRAMMFLPFGTTMARFTLRGHTPGIWGKVFLMLLTVFCSIILFTNITSLFKFRPYIQQAEANLATGEVGDWQILWNGTGGLVSPVVFVPSVYPIASP